MSKYIIEIGYARFEVDGLEAAWAAFQKAQEFAELVGQNALLYDCESCEYIA